MLESWQYSGSFTSDREISSLRKFKISLFYLFDRISSNIPLVFYFRVEKPLFLNLLFEFRVFSLSMVEFIDFF
jgi:hypothetical protein